MSESARVIVEVLAGLIPGQPEPEHTPVGVDVRRMGSGGPRAERGVGGAQRQSPGLLMLQPDRLNWVRVDWIWL